MGVKKENTTSYRLFTVAAILIFMSIAVSVKLFNIQWVNGQYYRELAKERSVHNFEIPANKGNIYSVDGSLLATSIPEYAIYFDAISPSDENFEKFLVPLSTELSKFFKKPAGYYQSELRKARVTKNRYFLIGKKLSFTQYMTVKKFPLFKLGPYKGGVITEQKTVRKYPVGQIANRTIGYEKDGNQGKGLEYAFRKYLNGKSGHRLMQKIAKNQWKPIHDANELEPLDGYDIVSTIDVYIQDIAHHALLKQLEQYKADHGCVVVMETQTGEIRAIANLGRKKDGTYSEIDNYAIKESHEPGSTFKLMDLIALLDDKKADTSSVYNSNGGVIYIHNKPVKDSNKHGYGSISLARGFEVSSNTVLVQATYKAYKDNPWQFINRINSYGLNKKMGLQIKGEGQPVIHQPGSKFWSGTTLPWMAFGYGVSMTPLQTLSLYNAIANNGKMMKPFFVKEVKEWNNTIKKYEPEVINPKICSDETLAKIKKVLENVVKKGTGKGLYSADFSMAGKTGTAQVNYNTPDMYYASSFVGYFPADHPKYSCIVVVHKPDKTVGYYGADVAGPVFKRIAQKIFTDVPSTNKFESVKVKNKKQEVDYATYYSKSQGNATQIPDVKGMPGMDAISILENLGLKVKVTGIGKVKSQSIAPGTSFKKNQVITLELS
ncbi:penicillin-binding protein [Flavobacterium sp. 20NA77.7]|uniref:Penicillin-binding protein n=1 Tax=Flavobacterium nakdongensis TaxID=3073563 RepID=A0ABY9RC32_9FLAO|nr:penicillin-binding protein [Flavobacterium sp. 20NA77.7]WMW78219.1 penicillin-binding protein [Flavobacterium sp. 20NA77.7]